jgi:DNA-binding MurR/RpiR family transcriptional regulator
MTTHSGNGHQIRERLSGDDFTPSEMKLVQILLADYPISGFGTQASLAKRAGVSDPTVLRFVTKLGFAGFTEFQGALLEEVEVRLRSPLLMIQAKADAPDASLAQGYLRVLARMLEELATSTVAQPYERAAELILQGRRVVMVGGRFSRNIASMFGGYVHQFRPDVITLSAMTTEAFDMLLDISKRDTIVVFDYRRYQNDVISFARQAAKRGARIILFTDPFMSPIASEADVVIVAPVDVSSPYDTMVTGVAQMEALVAHLVAKARETMQKRVSTLEHIRVENSVTVDGTAMP